MGKSILLSRLESDLALLLLKKLYEQEIGWEKAKSIAKFILKAIPENISDDELLKIIPKLDDNFPQLASIVIKYLEMPDKIKREKEIEKIRNILKK